MEYDARQWVNLVNAVEAEGGEHLDSVCGTTWYTDVKGRKQEISHCNHESKFKIPYELSGRDLCELGEVVVCAHDDGMAYWPRYRKAIFLD